MNNKSEAKILPIIIFSLILVGAFVVAFSGSGDGTPGDPFQITTCDQLNETRDNLTASYILMNDINFSECDASYTTGNGWVPIGNSTAGFKFNIILLYVLITVFSISGGYLVFRRFKRKSKSKGL